MQVDALASVCLPSAAVWYTSEKQASQKKTLTSAVLFTALPILVPHDSKGCPLTSLLANLSTLHQWVRRLEEEQDETKEDLIDMASSSAALELEEEACWGTLCEDGGG